MTPIGVRKEGVRHTSSAIDVYPGIMVDPTVHHGAPVVAGTRVPVHLAAALDEPDDQNYVAKRGGDKP